MTSPESVFGFRRIFLTHRVLRDSLPRTRHIHIRRNFHMNRNTSCHSFSNHRKPDAKPSVVSGFFFCLLIAVAAAILGRRIPVIGVIVLLGLYVSTVVLACIGSDTAMRLLRAAIYATIVLPVLLWAYSLIYKVLKRNYSPEAREELKRLKLGTSDSQADQSETDTDKEQ